MGLKIVHKWILYDKLYKANLLNPVDIHCFTYSIH